MVSLRRDKGFFEWWRRLLLRRPASNFCRGPDYSVIAGSRGTFASSTALLICCHDPVRILTPMKRGVTSRPRSFHGMLSEITSRDGRICLFGVACVFHLHHDPACDRGGRSSFLTMITEFLTMITD